MDRKFIVTDIEWDLTDISDKEEYEETLKELPIKTELELDDEHFDIDFDNKEVVNDVIGEVLCLTYGFCQCGFVVNEVKP